MKTNREESQKTMVKNHLIKYGHITPSISWDRYGCYRLSDVIFKLRKIGMNILTEIIHTQHNGSYARYFIPKIETNKTNFFDSN